MLVKYFYIAVLSLVAGIGLATFWPQSWPTLVWLMVGALMMSLLWRRSRSQKEIKLWLYAGFVLAFFVLGLMRTQLATESLGQSPLEQRVSERVSLQGQVVREVDRRETSAHLYVEVSEDLLLVTTDRYTAAAYGDVINFSGKLEKPESFATDLGRTFNYPGYLLAKGVEYKVSFAEVKVTQSEQGSKILTILLTFKHSLMKSIEANLPEPESGLGEGLLLGVKQALGDELELAFRQTGIIHIVVLSGYNIMLVVVFVMFILSSFLSARPRMIVGIIAISAFALTVGLSATVIRASLMACLLLVAQATGRIYLVLRALFLAGVVMILINPLLLVYDVGFQLSFLATLGLILVAPQIEQRLPQFLSSYGVNKFLVATVSTQIAVLPILLYQIGEFSVVAVVVNLLVLPMVPVAMLLTFAVGLAGFWWPTLASLLAYPAYLSLTYITAVASWFAGFDYAAFDVPAFSFYFVPIAYLGLGYLLYRYRLPLVVNVYGDFGERLLRKEKENSVKKTATADAEDLSTWTIEEEFDEKLGQKINKSKTAESLRDSAAKNDTPIFFR